MFNMIYKLLFLVSTYILYCLAVFIQSCALLWVHILTLYLIPAYFFSELVPEFFDTINVYFPSSYRSCPSNKKEGFGKALDIWMALTLTWAIRRNDPRLQLSVTSRHWWVAKYRTYMLFFINLTIVWGLTVEEFLLWPWVNEANVTVLVYFGVDASLEALISFYFTASVCLILLRVSYIIALFIHDDNPSYRLWNLFMFGLLYLSTLLVVYCYGWDALVLTWVVEPSFTAVCDAVTACQSVATSNGFSHFTSAKNVIFKVVLSFYATTIINHSSSIYRQLSWGDLNVFTFYLLASFIFPTPHWGGPYMG